MSKRIAQLQYCDLRPGDIVNYHTELLLVLEQMESSTRVLQTTFAPTPKSRLSWVASCVVIQNGRVTRAEQC